MADVAVPGSNSQAALRSLNTTNTPPQHGRKRSADGSLEHEQRLSKRFDLLNLVDTNGSRLYIPVPGSSSSLSTTHSLASSSPIPTADPLTFIRRPKPKKRPPRSTTTDDDVMQVEDTPHRVYIHDLSAELSDIESDEDTPIFLSDIEKHLSKIPRHVLLRGSSDGSQEAPKPTENNQVVLYNVPSSLSVPQDRDGVRKAIVEARQRIREKQGSGVCEVEGVTGRSSDMGGIGMEVDRSASPSTLSPPPSSMSQMDTEPDAMDID